MAIAGAIALILAATAHVTYMNDEWRFLLTRQDWDAESFFKPHFGHVVVAPVAFYKVLVGVFGAQTTLPVRIVANLALAASVVALFAYVRRRAGEWVALIAACLVLFLGAAAIDLMWAFQMCFTGSVACGIAALLALDREDRRGDVLACAALTGSIAFCTLGVSFLVGAAVHVATGARRKAQIFVWAVPGALYGLWWLGWGRNADSALSLSSLPDAPRYVFDAASQAMASLVGLAHPAPPEGLAAGHLLLVVLVVLTLVRVRALGWSRGMSVTLAIAGSFWVLAALNASVDRPPTADRYIYPSAVFILLFAAELMRGVKLPRAGLAGAGALAAVVVVAGVGQMRDYGEGVMQPTSDQAKAILTAADIAGPRLAPDDGIAIYDGGNRAEVRLLRRLEASSGPLGLTDSELAIASPALRTQTDTTLAALGVSQR